MRNLKLLISSITLALFLAHPAWAAVGFTDDSGWRVEVTKPFTRIISLYAAHTENLFSLGLDKEIVGVSMSESYPPKALSKPAFSHRDDPERFLAARPDLVLIRPMIARGKPALVQRLRQAGITVVSLQPRGVEALAGYWLRLGLLTGKQAQARGMTENFQNRVKSFETRLAPIPKEKKPRVYFESIHKKMKTFAPGAMALFTLEAAGGLNAAPDARSVRGTNIAEYGKERILARGRDIDVFLAQVGVMNRVTVRDIKTESGFKAIKAVRQGKVFLVDEKLVSRPTLRLLDGINKIHSLLYPKGPEK